MCDEISHARSLFYNGSKDVVNPEPTHPIEPIPTWLYPNMISCVRFLMLAAFLLCTVSLATQGASLKGNIGLTSSATLKIPTGSHTVTLTSDLTTGYYASSLTVVNNNDADVTLEFKAVAELMSDINWPKGTKNLLLLGRIGFKVALVSPDNASGTKIIIKWKYDLGLAGEASKVLKGSVKAFGMQFDAETQTYVTIASSVSGSDSLSFEPRLPSGQKEITFYVVGFDINEQIPCGFNYPFSVVASADTERQYRFGSDDDLLLKLKSKNSFTLTASKRSSNPHPDAEAPSADVSAFAFFSIEPGYRSNPDFTGTIQYKLSADANAEISTLKLAYFKIDSNAWVHGEGSSSVDTEARTVSQATTHFSDWAVYGVSNDAHSMANGKNLLSAALVISTMALLIMM